MTGEAPPREAVAISIWAPVGVVERFEAGTLHYHPCPECYWSHPCTAACSHEPDLDEHGRLSGAYCVCENCEAAKPVAAGDEVE